MAQNAVSPPARRLRPPSWLTARVLAGTVLVLAATAGGAGALGAADRSVEVWAVDDDVAAGSTLTRADLRAARVRLFDAAGGYLPVSEPLAGRTVDRAIRRGELVPSSAVRGDPPGVLVPVPVPAQNAPAVEPGQAVDVWSTAPGCAPRRLLADAAVQDVRAGGGPVTGAGTVTLVLRVAPDLAGRVVAALGTADAEVRVTVLVGGPGPAVGADPARCIPADGS